MVRHELPRMRFRARSWDIAGTDLGIGVHRSEKHYSDLVRCGQRRRELQDAGNRSFRGGELHSVEERRGCWFFTFFRWMEALDTRSSTMYGATNLVRWRTKYIHRGFSRCSSPDGVPFQDQGAPPSSGEGRARLKRRWTTVWPGRFEFRTVWP